MTDEDRDWALEFARAIVKPGGSAALLDPDNRHSGWVSIEEAVASGMAYMVEPRDGILPLDLDEEADWKWSDRVRAALEPLGCRFVVTNSGRSGHGHLWIIAPAGWSAEFTKSQAHALAGEHSGSTARKRTATRPPYSPHRCEPVRSRVIKPGAAQALALFRSTHPQPLPAQMRKILDGLDPSVLKKNRGTPSRGKSLHAVACSAVNRRWTYQEFLSELRESRGLAATKFNELPPAAREDFAEGVWKAAVEFVRGKPAVPSSELARTALRRLSDALPDLDWPSRTGASDRAVYGALIHFGTQGATTEVSASIRQLAKQANLSNDGVSDALRRLEGRRMLERLPAPSYGLANRYRLLPQGAADLKACGATDNNSLPRGDQRYLLSDPTPLLNDLFGNGGSGLGLSCRETWEALTREPTKVKELATKRPGQLQVATIRAHLRELENYGLAARNGHRWWRVEPDDETLQRLTSMLGVRGKSEARAEYNARQVQQYRERFSISPRARTTSGELDRPRIVGGPPKSAVSIVSCAS